MCKLLRPSGRFDLLLERRTAEGQRLLHFFVGMILQKWTKETNDIFCVVNLCETQCLYHVISLIMKCFIEPIHAFNVFFSFSVSPVIFLTADMLAHFCSDRSSAVNMYIIISYVSSDLHHMFMVSLFFKGEHQDVTVLVPLVHFF